MFKKLKKRLEFLHFHTVHMRSRRAIEAWQLRRLRMIVTHAQKNVPLYTALYAAQGTGAKDIETLDDIRKLPIVTKRMFLGKETEEYTDNSAPLRGLWATTSGTSGEPFTMLTRRQFKKLMYLESIVYRAFFWETTIASSRLRIARILTKTNRRRNRYFVTITDFLKNPIKEIEGITAFKPEVIESFASILHELAKTVEQNRLPLRTRYVISGGEQMTDGLRRYIESVLGCEVYNRYGMEEFAVVGMECAKHDGLHTNCESLYVEIVDDAGLPLPDGEYGRIIVTDLYNVGMPFIRYDTGDHGRLSRERCACGKSSPRVWLEGRYSAFLVFGGRRINHLEFDAALETFMNVILQYQVVKIAEDRAVVKVIPGPAFNGEAEQKIVRNVEALTGGGVRVEVEQVLQIPRVARGKSRIVADLSTGDQPPILPNNPNL